MGPSDLCAAILFNCPPTLPLTPAVALANFFSMWRVPIPFDPRGSARDFLGRGGGFFHSPSKFLQQINICFVLFVGGELFFKPGRLAGALLKISVLVHLFPKK